MIYDIDGNLICQDDSLAFKKLVIKNKKHLYEAILNDVDLSDADLSCANLEGACLIDANLSGANLRYVNLEEASLREANLTNADLRHSNLDGANLSDADLTGAKLDGANLNNTFINGAKINNKKILVVKEIKFGFEKYSLKCFMFNDDSFLFMFDSFSGTLDELKTENISLEYIEAATFLKYLCLKYKEWE